MSSSPTKNGGIGSPSRVTLMERQALETGDASMLATLRIGELDKLVAKMKQRQAICLSAIEHYNGEIGHIETEVKHIMERYTPMCKRLEERRKERDMLQRQSDDVARQFGDILATTKHQLRVRSHEHVQHIRKEAAAELSGVRGYDIGRSSTVYQKASPLRK